MENNKTKETIYEDCFTDEIVTLDYVCEATFEKTSHNFSKQHYELACKLADMENNLGHILVAKNGIDLIVAFDFSENRLDREIQKNLYRVTITPPPVQDKKAEE